MSFRLAAAHTQHSERLFTLSPNKWSTLHFHFLGLSENTMASRTTQLVLRLFETHHVSGFAPTPPLIPDASNESFHPEHRAKQHYHRTVFVWIRQRRLRWMSTTSQLVNVLYCTSLLRKRNPQSPAWSLLRASQQTAIWQSWCNYNQVTVNFWGLWITARPTFPSSQVYQPQWWTSRAGRALAFCRNIFEFCLNHQPSVWCS